MNLINVYLIITTYYPNFSVLSISRLLSSRVQVRGSKPGEIVVSRSVMFYTINLVKRTREAPDPLKTHPVKKSYGGTKIIIYNQSFSTFT